MSTPTQPSADALKAPKSEAEILLGELQIAIPHGYSRETMLGIINHAFSRHLQSHRDEVRGMVEKVLKLLQGRRYQWTIEEAATLLNQLKERNG